ncbi:MAG TPA: citramalate synthase, partial [Solirubrobacteraceae bacterium]|nr:citramalate synthase [Solirubrobacteraceae bacterium]
MPDIQLYDATLRDGMGGGGLTLTAEEKLRVVHALDALGVHLIEAGFPASNPKEQELFELLAGERLERAEIVAFGMTRRRDASAERDDGLRVLAESFAPVCTLVGKASVLHVEKVVRVSREENLAMVAESVAFLVGAGKRVLLDAEHFFDGFALDPAYALDCLRAAADAGAERLVLCDTNGGSLPPQIRTAFAVVREALPGAQLGIHTHDDSGCAVANTLTAVECGATQVQGTINGIGERTGNANLITIIADLQLKMGVELLPAERLARLTETAHFVDELLNRAPNPAQPYVGKHAFAHKAGLHAAGVRAEPQTFEHIDPAVVGNSRDVLISELSGRGTIVEKARQAGLPADERFAQRVVERVKELEHEGFQFEAADGSFELLMRKEAGAYEPLFRLESWRVLVEKRADGKVETEATIKIWLAGERYVRTAEGNGPVNALDNALRAAIGEIHPHVRDIELVNFKVRILDEAKGTGAVTRVLLDASDGDRVWGSIGVS